MATCRDVWDFETCWTLLPGNFWYIQINNYLKFLWQRPIEIVLRILKIAESLRYLRVSCTLEIRLDLKIRLLHFFIMWPLQNLRRAFSNPLNRRYYKSRSRCVQQRSNLWWLSTLKGSLGDIWWPLLVVGYTQIILNSLLLYSVT